MRFRIVRYTDGKYRPQFFSEFDNQWINICKDSYSTESEAKMRCTEFMENDEITQYKHVTSKFEL